MKLLHPLGNAHKIIALRRPLELLSLESSELLAVRVTRCDSSPLCFDCKCAKFNIVTTYIKGLLSLSQLVISTPFSPIPFPTQLFLPYLAIMFRNFASQLTAAAGANDRSKKVPSPTLRSDIYSLVDKIPGWIAGGGNQSGAAGQAGDGVSYTALLALIQKHIPDTKKLGLEFFGQLDSEIAIIVGGVTNLILELSRWEHMSAGMAMRTWVDCLVDGYFKASNESRKELIAKGIMRGLNGYTDATLLTKDLTTRIQIITCLKTGEPTRFDSVTPFFGQSSDLSILLLVSSRIYGPGTDEARQNEAIWSSKFI